jgi:hypothetical protein
MVSGHQGYVQFQKGPATMNKLPENKLRYELRYGRFGAYFHDNKLEHPKYGGAMDLNDVLCKLNQHAAGQTEEKTK